MKTLIFFLSFLVLVSCANTETTHPTKEHDYFVVLSQLLENYPERHQFTDDEGKQQTDELAHFKELEAIYIRTFTPIAGSELSDKQIKLALFFAFYASLKNSAAISEYLAEDLPKLFNAQPKTFISTLDELPFLVRAVCDRLARGIESLDRNKVSDELGTLKETHCVTEL